MHLISISSTGAPDGLRLCRLPPPDACSFSLATNAARLQRPAMGRVGAATSMELGGHSCHRSKPLGTVRAWDGEGARVCRDYTFTVKGLEFYDIE